MKSSILSYSVLMLLLLFGCSNLEVEQNINPQEVYFEVAHTNQSWGKINQGFIVDKTGTIRSYKNPKIWHKSISFQDSLTSNDIKENIANTTETSIKVSETDLSTYTNKIFKITTSEFTKPVSVGNDMGETNYIAYQFDAKSGLYRQILLSQKGNFEKNNKDKNAQEIVIWLESIQAKL